MSVPARYRVKDTTLTTHDQWPFFVLFSLILLLTICKMPANQITISTVLKANYPTI